MVDVLLPASRKGLPVGTTIAHGNADVLLAGSLAGEPVDKVIPVVTTLAVGLLVGRRYSGAMTTRNRHTINLPHFRLFFNPFHSLVL